MQSVFILFIVLIGIGLFARNFDGRVRLLIIIAAACMVAFVTVK